MYSRAVNLYYLALYAQDVKFGAKDKANLIKIRSFGR